MIIIADSSCLISLHNTHHLDLLQLVFGKITITKEVANEFHLSTPQWITVVEISNRQLFDNLNSFLGEGEASSIALAVENPGSLLILDELEGRKAAKKYSLQVTGTIGIIGRAKQLGLIDFVKPIITELKTAGFRISEELEIDFLKQNNEL